MSAPELDPAEDVRSEGDPEETGTPPIGNGRAVFRVDVDLDHGFADLSGRRPPTPAEMSDLGRRLVQLGQGLIARGVEHGAG